MISEVFIENQRADITEDISSLLTFELDNIKDFSARSTTWSKTIVLPGTANNNKLFGGIFQVGQANNYNSNLSNISSNFNASKSAFCLIFQDNLQAFKGVLRLLQINIIKGRIEYEVAVFGELAGLNVALSSSKLEDLDFSAYDHVYNTTNILASWDNVSGVNYFYPLIDHGTYSTNKKDWDIRTFRPALHAREYIDKMFTAAGYRWSSDLFNTDRFKRLIVPYNRKEMTIAAESYLDTTNVSGQTIIQSDVFPVNRVKFPVQIQNNGFTPSDANGHTWNYDNPTTINPEITVTLRGSYVFNSTFPPDQFSCTIYSIRSGTPTALFTTLFPVALSSTPFEISFGGTAEIIQNDDITVIFSGGSFGSTWTVSITSGELLIAPAASQEVAISVGDTVEMNRCIPKNVRQIDFLVSIVKLFNLYVYEDRFDSKLIYFTPYVDFYGTDSSNSVDWTYKLNRDKNIAVKPMAELNSKKYEFKYKSDSDYYNDLYRKRYGQGYGDYVFDSQFEFSQETNSLELIFSATVLVGYPGEEKIYSTIFKQSNSNEETTDSNIRILQSRKITGVASYAIKDGVTTLTSTTNYGYAGHLDDPDAPSNDLNFGTLSELFFTLVTGDLSNTQFNLYWSSYMAEITDKDSKFFSGWFYLKAQDILALDFSKFVFIDGILYRLNSIKDYNVTKPSDCQVELIKVNFLIY